MSLRAAVAAGEACEESAVLTSAAFQRRDSATS